MNVVIIVALAMFAAQVIISSICLAVGVNEFNKYKNEPYYANTAKAAQKQVRISSKMLMLSPLSIIVLPLTLVMLIGLGIKKATQSTLTVMNTEI